MAATLLMEISQDEHERARLRSRRMYETDRYSDITTAKERGELEKALKIAKNLKVRGLSVEDIAEDTGLTVDDILRMK
jgi:predicted transposase/invertase (TIGR01784 family)